MENNKMDREMKDKITQSLRSLVTEMFCKVHSNELEIPEAVERMMILVESDFSELKEEKRFTNHKVDPLFQKGKLPIEELSHCSIQEIKPMENGGYKYFIFNSYNSYASGWLTEDELIERIEIARKKNSKNL